MDSWKGILIGFTFIALFAFSVINYSYLMQSNNGINGSNNVINQPIFNQLNSSINNNLNILTDSANNQQNASISEQASEQNPAGALVLSSIFLSFGRFASFLFDFGAVFINLIGAVVPIPVVTSVLFSILIIVTIYAFWRLIKIAQ